MPSVWRKSKLFCSVVVMFILLGSFIPASAMAAEKSSEAGKTSDKKVLPKKGLNTWVPSGDFASSLTFPLNWPLPTGQIPAHCERPIIVNPGHSHLFVCHWENAALSYCS